MPTRRLGLLGGTFDPPHYGHLWLAETARDQLRLDKVLFLPVGVPPHKPDAPVTSVQHRVEMVRLAVDGHGAFCLSTLDCERPGPHTTVTLLPLLREAFPDSQFWLLLGGDSLRDLAGWHRPRTLISQVRLAVLERPGAQVELPVLNKALPGLEQAVDWLRGPALSISATALRAWVTAGYSIRYLTPDAVCDYISAHGLYN